MNFFNPATPAARYPKTYPMNVGRERRTEQTRRAASSKNTLATLQDLFLTGSSCFYDGGRPKSQLTLKCD